jgi:hypothetical protein
LHVLSIAKRTTTPSSVPALVDSFYGLSFACREDSYTSTQFAEILETISPTPGDVTLLDAEAIHHSSCFRILPILSG